jgi:DNA-3-methyladenine glycosylase
LGKAARIKSGVAVTAAQLKRAPTLPRSFYERDPVTVSREVLGKVVVRESGGELLAGRIVECEAYLGADDAAAHAASGRTERNSVLFGPAGHAYVYFIYGVHYCLNFSCLPDGEAGGTLIRALEPLAGIEHMQHARKLHDVKQLTNGPGKLAQAFHITRTDDNGKDVCSRRSDLRVVDDGFVVRPGEVVATTRIGITKAADLPLRFLLKNSAFVSRPAK